MSFCNGGYTAVFPTEWIKKCIATYTKEHGKAPKLLVVSENDYIDYRLNLSIHDAKSLGIEVRHGDYLKVGEIDLAMGIEKKNKRKTR